MLAGMTMVVGMTKNADDNCAVGMTYLKVMTLPGLEFKINFMKTMLIIAALIMAPVSLVGASTTNSVLSMTTAPYIKWQSAQTSNEAKVPENLIDRIAGFLGNNGEKSKSVVSELQKTGLNYDASEITHLTDVKNVFNGVRTANKSSLLLLAASLAILMAFKGILFTLKMLYKICFLITALLIVFLVASYFGFDTTFDSMHKLLFREGTWLFPDESFFIRLFPYEFWRNSAAIAFAGSTGQIVALGLVSRFLFKRLT